MRSEKEIRDFAGRMQIVYECYVDEEKSYEATSALMIRDLLEWVLGADNATGVFASRMEADYRAYQRARRN